MVFKGRLGLATAQIPQADRHGLMWIGRGKLYVEDGCLSFVTAGTSDVDPGNYQIPYQMLTCLLIAPGTTVSHDALRLLARHGTGLLAVGDDGVRCYASCMPEGANSSRLARRQVMLWAKEESRIDVARRMFAKRFKGPLPPQRDLNALRGIEATRARQMYALMAQRFGVSWDGRKYDRANPEGGNSINQSINHVSTAVRAAATIAVASTSTIPQLGFIHEASAHAFSLDIADLMRDEVTLPVAFEAVKLNQRRPGEKIERTARRLAGVRMREDRVVAKMIDHIKELLDGNDSDGNP